MSDAFTFTSRLWRWSAREGTSEPGSWCFVTVPRDVSDEIRELAAGPPRGFGSVRVAVEAGSSRWDTSVFPDAGSGCFVLPVKKAVRDREGIEEGDDVTVSLRVRSAP